MKGELQWGPVPKQDQESVFKQEQESFSAPSVGCLCKAGASSCCCSINMNRTGNLSLLLTWTVSARQASLLCQLVYPFIGSICYSCFSVRSCSPVLLGPYKHSHKQPYTVRHSQKQPYTTIHCHTQLYKAIHSHTQLYTVIHSHTKPYTALHIHTQSYTVIHSHTQPYTAIHSHSQGLLWLGVFQNTKFLPTVGWKDTCPLPIHNPSLYSFSTVCWECFRHGQDPKDGPWPLRPDFLKANSLAQSNCSDWKFWAETCGKNDITICETRRKEIFKLWQIDKITAIFPVLRLLFKKLRRFSNTWRNHVNAWLQLLETQGAGWRAWH